MRDVVDVFDVKNVMKHLSASMSLASGHVIMVNVTVVQASIILMDAKPALMNIMDENAVVSIFYQEYNYFLNF